MSKLSALAVATLALGLLGGCRDKPPGPAPSSSVTVGTTTASRTPRAEPYASERLPDEADYANEADKEISDDNFAAKLAELEREIAEGEAALADAGAAAHPASPDPTTGANPR